MKNKLKYPKIRFWNHVISEFQYREMTQLEKKEHYNFHLFLKIIKYEKGTKKK